MEKSPWAQQKKQTCLYCIASHPRWGHTNHNWFSMGKKTFPTLLCGEEAGLELFFQVGLVFPVAGLLFGRAFIYIGSSLQSEIILSIFRTSTTSIPVLTNGREACMVSLRRPYQSIWVLGAFCSWRSLRPSVANRYSFLPSGTKVGTIGLYLGMLGKMWR